MSKNKRMRFKLAEYATGYELKEKTGKILEGTVVRHEGEGFSVRLEGYELPFYVAPEDIIEADKGDNGEET